jgi:hypothetical protein
VRFIQLPQGINVGHEIVVGGQRARDLDLKVLTGMGNADYATPEICKKYVLERIDREIRRLESFQKEHGMIAKSRLEIEKLRQHVPDDLRAERLLRYEASLERAFDRTLSQLERIQRMRKGQVVPPPINLNLTT